MQHQRQPSPANPLLGSSPRPFWSGRVGNLSASGGQPGSALRFCSLRAQWMRDHLRASRSVRTWPGCSLVRLWRTTRRLRSDLQLCSFAAQRAPGSVALSLRSRATHSAARMRDHLRASRSVAPARNQPATNPPPTANQAAASAQPSRRQILAPRTRWSGPSRRALPLLQSARNLRKSVLPTPNSACREVSRARNPRPQHDASCRDHAKITLCIGRFRDLALPQQHIAGTRSFRARPRTGLVDVALLGGPWCSLAPGGAGWWKLVNAWFRVAFAWRLWRRLHTPFLAKTPATRIWPESSRHLPEQLRPMFRQTSCRIRSISGIAL
jgi:hypothetical protein